MWLLQTASASVDGFTPSAIILALAGVVSTLAVKLLSVWQERVKAAEAEERKASERLAALRDAEVEFWRTHALELDSQLRAEREAKAKNFEAILEAIGRIRAKGTEPPRNDSPPPGSLQLPNTGYSISRTPTKTRK